MTNLYDKMLLIRSLVARHGDVEANKALTEIYVAYDTAIGEREKAKALVRQACEARDQARKWEQRYRDTASQYQYERDQVVAESKRINEAYEKMASVARRIIHHLGHDLREAPDPPICFPDCRRCILGESLVAVDGGNFRYDD